MVPNEAHNGYLEVYLNLGWVGIVLLGIVIVTGYRTVFRFLRQDPEIGRLKLVYFVVGLAYSFTEAGFRNLTPIWIAFLLAVVNIPINRNLKTGPTFLTEEPKTRQNPALAMIEPETVLPS